jgi:hypothetical protein
MAVKLGAKVKDLISGFEGIATGRCEYLYGCAQIIITPDKIGDKGERLDGEWFDEQRVEVIEARPIPVSAASSATSGGPQRDAPRGR